jgi:hypothetical protein
MPFVVKERCLNEFEFASFLPELAPFLNSIKLYDIAWLGFNKVTLKNSEVWGKILDKIHKVGRAEVNR